MIHGILFDLDGTLLDIDLQRFLGRYFGALREVALSYATAEAADTIMEAIQSGTRAMMEVHPDATTHTRSHWSSRPCRYVVRIGAQPVRPLLR